MCVCVCVCVCVVHCTGMHDPFLTGDLAWISIYYMVRGPTHIIGCEKKRNYDQFNSCHNAENTENVWHRYQDILRLEWP